jgi:hypothetical protein
MSDSPPEYGVVDYPEQLGFRFPNFVGSKEFFPVYRKEQPYGLGGWRWHKWGPYLGTYNIRGMEYLSYADGNEGRPKIDVQWCFSDDRTCLGAKYETVYFGNPGSRTKKALRKPLKEEEDEKEIVEEETLNDPFYEYDLMQTSNDDTNTNIQQNDIKKQDTYKFDLSISLDDIE